MHLSTLFAPGRVVRRPSSPARVAGRMVAMLATVAATALTWSAAPSQAATSQPCDIYAAGGTPCVAAHSTTRALYGNYNGSLYQVRRSSDNATRDIGVLSTGGVANAATQDAFCANTTCLITIIYDQSGRNNRLTQAPPGGFNGPAAGGYDNLANAAAAPITVGG
ncbi:arabinofuranosidase catalytic domain-containing protein, partial [Microbispora bryophytorum]|uniref:arabinofuranosidase catalytic domain-containing protein n=2 Tax=Microbispora bryophytorum TaxID=1460882 RepID=UPI0036789112